MLAVQLDELLCKQHPFWPCSEPALLPALTSLQRFIDDIGEAGKVDGPLNFKGSTYTVFLAPTGKAPGSSNSKDSGGSSSSSNSSSHSGSPGSLPLPPLPPNQQAQQPHAAAPASPPSMPPSPPQQVGLMGALHCGGADPRSDQNFCTLTLPQFFAQNY